MASMFRYIVILQCLVFSAILADNNNEQKKNYLNYFLDYMNNLPDQLYSYEDGILVNVQEIAANVFNIESNVKVSEVQNPKKFKLLRCTGRIVDSKSSGLSMVRDSCYCQEDVKEPNVVTEATNVPEADITQDDYSQTTEALFIQLPVKLDNEVQPENAATSGEQFIAIPRVSPSPCIGCSSHVDVAAAGVQELATLAVRHLQRHEPNVKHTLRSVADVERQVQAVNGVRFILTLTINYNNCSIEVNDNCQGEKACKISILEKPWLKLPDGSKFRVIMSNNCTDEWIFGDNGEVLPPVAENTEDNDLKNDSSGDNIIKVHEVGLQNQIPSHERHLTEEELKTLEDQIIPINQFNQLPEFIQLEPLKQPLKSVEVNELPSSKKEFDNTYKEVIDIVNKTQEPAQDSISDVTEKSMQSTISDEKKHAIDDLMKFFDIDIHPAGNSKNDDEERTNLRTKRNYNYDLHVHTKAQRYRKIKRKFENANYIYNLAKQMVDYVNDMDLELKNRVLQDVVQAEEETDGNLKFVYIKARAISKCDKDSCSKAVKQSFLCQALIETTNPEAPVLLDAFCSKKDASESEREWLEDGKLVNATCEDIRNNELIRRKRNANLTFVGGPQEQDANNIKYVNLAKDALNKYQSFVGNGKFHEVIAINRVTTKIVAGILTEIDFKVCEMCAVDTDECKDYSKTLNCNARIWDRSWLPDGREINVNCEDIKQNNTNIEHKGTTKKRREIVFNSLMYNDADLGYYKILAQEALDRYQLLNNVNILHTILKVDNVELEKSPGKYILIDFHIAPTNCKLNDEIDLTGCIVQNGTVLSCHSKIKERVDLNDRKDIRVYCKPEEININTRTSMPGGIVEDDPTLTKYLIMAKLSLQQLYRQSNIKHVHRVLAVDRVTNQVVGGLLTKIFFRITSTTCLLANKLYVESNCEPQNPKTVIRCQSQFWQRPWLAENKSVNIKCSGPDSGDTLKRDYNDVRFKRKVEKKNVNDKEYIDLAREALHKFELVTKPKYAYKVVKIDRVTTEVVYSILTKLYFKISPTICRLETVQNVYTSTCPLQDPGIATSCFAEVWDVISEFYSMSDQNQMRVVCQQDMISRQKRNIPHGGITDQDPDNGQYKLLVEESLQQYHQLAETEYVHKLKKIEKVTTQVGQGMLTKIYFSILPTTCRIGNVSLPDISKCDVKSTGDNINCLSEVWERPWLPKTTQIEVKCNKTSKDEEAVKEKEFAKSVEINKEQHIRARRWKSKPLGEEYEDDVDKHKNIALAEEALRKYESISNSEFMHKVSKINKVFRKVVSGLLTKIDFTVLETVCATNVSKLEIHNNNSCELKTPSVGKNCHAEIWERAWLKSKQIDIHCKKSKAKKHIKTNTKKIERSKRQALGGDVNKDTRYYYADRAIRCLNSQSNTNNLYKVVSIYSMQSSYHMEVLMVRMYMDVALTFCTKDAKPQSLERCNEMEGVNHKTCLARLWPSSRDELVLENIKVVCEDDDRFAAVAGFSVKDLIDASLKKLEKSSNLKYKVIPRREARLIPSLDSNDFIKLTFVVSSLNCTKDKPSKVCHSYIWLAPNERRIHDLKVVCIDDKTRIKRYLQFANTTLQEESEIKKFVDNAISKLEMSNLHSFKQRLIRINSYTTKLTSGRQTTIDFDVGYTTCMKYEYVEDITTCNFLEHLPRRRCLATVWQRLRVSNGESINVGCDDDETPLEAHIKLENANATMELAKNALKHIEAKYPHPFKQKIVRILSLEKQTVAGIHYRMKMEVGLTNCPALTARDDCNVTNEFGLNKFCRVNIWLRPWVNHGANYRVSCDYKEAMTADIYMHVQAEHLFGEFIKTYRPHYIDDWVEMAKRFEIFKDNVKKIHEFNTHDKGTATYAVTRFADLTHEEFKSKYLGLRPGLRDPNQIPMSQAVIPNVQLPDKFDWRDQGAVTEVKNQGLCGSCWAFSVTGNIEGQWKLQTGQLLSLSEQELVDCDKLDEGCNGGLPDNAYRAIEQLGGLETEKDYPYEGEDDKCEYNKTLSRVQISGAVNISSNETEMAKWLLKHGPISIGINANAMQFYMGGVSHPWKVMCNPENLDHGVLIVGYGIKDYPLFNKKMPYWIVKNSWGKSWGEQGYYRVYRGDGTCGVNMMASSAVI